MINNKLSVFSLSLLSLSVASSFVSTSVNSATEVVSEQPHVLNVNVFDTELSQPIYDGIYQVEAVILDKSSSANIGEVYTTCEFLNGSCGITINNDDLNSGYTLNDLANASFLIKVPQLLDDHTITHDVQPVLYARVAEYAQNVAGNISPDSVDTQSILINGSEVINQDGEWVGNTAGL
ncbi:TPA: collagen-like protein, partial [Vibrio campbellii]|nr:collagen-like protein [Vibrio campbellii]